MSEVSSETDEAKARRARRWKIARTIGRVLLFVFGVAAVVYLVMDVGPGKVWRTLIAAGVWVPLIAFFEIVMVSMDVLSLRMIFGERAREIPTGVWLRSAVMAYGVMILLPAGRAGGEVIRAASLGPYVGGARAAAAATLLQGVTLWGNTLISIPCYIACATASGPFSALSLLVLGNGTVTALLGSLVLFGARFSSLGGWLGRRIKALAAHGESFDESLREMPALPIMPIGAALAGRISQLAQYAILLVAVGGAFTLVSALVAQAIHLVGAGLGDMVPNGVGITESAFHFLGGSLNLRDTAIAIALLHRVVQFSLAGLSLLVGALWHPAEKPSAAPEPA
jgi:hypothetical protein